MIDRTDHRPLRDNPVFRIRDYINISIYSVGLRGFTFTLWAILVPVLLLDLVAEGDIAEDRKNAFLGLATFVALALGIVAQPVAGALSDRFHLRWGKRHPYIFLGTVAACFFVPGLALSSSFLAILGLLTLITIAVNVAQGPFQAFILDFVPPEKRGMASAHKTGAEILGVASMGALIGFFIGKYQAPDGFEWIWVSVGLLVGFYLGTMVLTLLRVSEGTLGLAHTNAPQVSSPTQKDARDSFFPPGFPWYLVSRFLALAATGIMETFGLFYLDDVVEVERPAEAAGILFMVIGATALLGAYAAGWLSQYLGYRRVIAFSGLVGAIGILMLLRANDMSDVAVSGIVIGIGVGIFFSADWALATALVSPNRAAQQMGLVHIATGGASPWPGYRASEWMPSTPKVKTWATTGSFTSVVQPSYWAVSSSLPSAPPAQQPRPEDRGCHHTSPHSLLLHLTACWKRGVQRGKSP